MPSDVELLIFPYDALEGRTLLHRLLEELKNGEWAHFQAAVAFAKVSGNFPDLLDALEGFAERGGRIDLTFGADRFAGESKGSDYDAIAGVVEKLKSQRTASVYLYHEDGRTFHPKVYLFSNIEQRRALVVIGSANWSEGGFGQNVEANVVLRLNLADERDERHFGDLQKCFDEHWKEK